MLRLCGLSHERDTYRRGIRLCLLRLCVALSRKRHIQTWRTFVYATSMCLFLAKETHTDVSRVCVCYVCVSLSHERDTYRRGEHLCMLRLCVFFSNVLTHITLGWHHSMKNGIQTQHTYDMTDSTVNAAPLNPPNRETHISRRNFKLNQNSNLNLYREIPRNLSFSIWWISRV